MSLASVIQEIEPGGLPVVVVTDPDFPDLKIRERLRMEDVEPYNAARIRALGKLDALRTRQGE